MSAQRNKSDATSRPGRTIFRTRRSLALAAANLMAYSGLALMVACADAPTGVPATTPSPAAASHDLAGLVGTTTQVVSQVLASPTRVRALLWSRPLPFPVTAAAIIGPAGGTFGFANGLRVTVPANTVAEPTRFSITALPGAVVAYDFEPHGTTWSKPLLLEQPTGSTNFNQLPATATIQGGYFADASLVNSAGGTADVSELIDTASPSNQGFVRFYVKHFSGYMVSTGFADPAR